MIRFHPPAIFKYTLAIIAFSVMTYFIAVCFQQYFAYPTQTRVTIRSNRSQVFPAVTICSGNPFRFDKFQPALISYILSQNTSLSLSNITEDIISSEIFSFVADLINQNKTNQLFSYGYQLEDILIDCYYNGYNCQTMWTRTFSPIIGNCFTFNRQTIDKQTKLFQINDIDGQTQDLDSGLIMTFYLNSELYCPTVGYGIGLIGILHNPDEQPLMRYSGQRFASGFEYNLIYEKSISTYLGSPYTPCTTIMHDDMKILYKSFDNNTDYVYSETVCIELCQQAFMYEQCGCIFPIYFYINQLVIDGELRWVRICTPWSAEYRCTIAARQQITINPNLEKDYCSHCQSQCTIYKYSSELSALKGPSDSQRMYYTNLLLSNSTIPIPSDFSTNSSYYLDRNFLTLSIVPSNSYETTYEEKATYTWSAFISDLGGQSGLWMGVSVLSLLELVEYLYKKIQVNQPTKKTTTEVQAFDNETVPKDQY